MAQPIVTVFGGTGFLGQEIVHAILRAGLHVRIASRRPPRGALSAVDGNIDHIVTDVRNEQSVAEAVRGASAVVNSVSLYAEKGEASFEAIHVHGAERIARCAREASAQMLVHISGLGV